jgi:uncharacterized protein with von Willebrand factor type A (vWA) domain
LNAFAPKTFRFDKWFDALLRGNKNAIHFTKMKSRHIWIYFLFKKSETISKVGIHIQLSNKLDNKAKGIFIGYDGTSAAYKIYHAKESIIG